MKNLENYGVLELNAKQMKETDGGYFWQALAVAVAVYGAYQGFVDGFNEAVSENTGGVY